MDLLAWLLIFIFTLISILHFYWAFGGRWGLENAIPLRNGGQPLFKVDFLSCLVVALGLLGFAFYYYLQVNGLSLGLRPSFISVVGWIIPSIFLIRAIGDFKYCGLFKRERSSLFARLDTRYFTPLCLSLSFLGYLWSIITQ